MCAFRFAIAMIGRPAAERAAALASLATPDVLLRPVDGSPPGCRDYHGRKRLVVAFVSWPVVLNIKPRVS